MNGRYGFETRKQQQGVCPSPARTNFSYQMRFDSEVDMFSEGQTVGR